MRNLRKQLLALLCAMALLASAGSAFAASPGSSQDPLLSKSFVQRWVETLCADRAAQAEKQAGALVTDAARSIEMLRGRCGAAGVRRVVLPPDGAVLLSAGDGMTLLSGSGELRVQRGAAVDVTAGALLPSGSYPAGHRCILDQDSAALFSPAGTCVLVLTGAGIVSQYRDSAPGQWFGAAVDYATTRNLMNGTADGVFSPKSTLTRAMFVTILGRMAGVKEADWAGTSFDDVATGTWYAPYVQWAAKNGIVDGVAVGKFAPNSPVTREQMAALVIRYADAAKKTLPAGVDVPASFRDAGSISGWAFESVDRMRQTGLLNGDENGNFNPKNGATRAEAATVFMRLDATMKVI